MSGKLDQSLDEILTSQRRNQQGRRRSTRRTAGTARPAPTAPAGGIQKNTKPARGATKPTPAKAAGLTGESKIMVSNLPKDVSEGQIKDYFQQSVGQVKKVEISYGPGGISRGIAHVTFHHADGASKAFSTLNGLLIDNKPVKVRLERHLL
jgi:THO complex subunit 4